MARDWSIMFNKQSYVIYTLIAFSDDDIFAAGYMEEDNNGNKMGSMLHYDGVTWAPISLSSIALKNICFTGLWGSSPNDVFAVGNAATIIHYDGSSWNYSNYVDEFYYDVTGVWGTSFNNVYVVAGDRIVHYDGLKWNTDFIDVSGNLWFTDIWGTSVDNIFAIGYGGSLAHFDGIHWTTMDSGTNFDLWDIWGSSAEDIFISGSEGTILHYDGVKWSTMDINTTLATNGICGTSSTDVYGAASNSVFHYDGNQWTIVQNTPNNDYQWLMSICVSPRKSIYAAGNGVIMMLPANNAPTVPDYDVVTSENTAVSGVVEAMDADGDTLTYSLLSQASNGIAIVNSDGTWTYTPNAAYNGSDNFTVEVNDGNGAFAISNIRINIIPVSTITVITPNGVEIMTGGRSYNIEWSYYGNPGTVTIDLIKSGTLVYTIAQNVSAGTNGSGSYSWRIQNNTRIGSDYRIRITSIANNSITDTSDNDFTILSISGIVQWIIDIIRRLIGFNL